MPSTVSLLLPFTTGFADESPANNSVTVYGAPVIASGGIAGRASVLSVGTADYLKYATAPALGTADYTVEFWVYSRRGANTNSGLFAVGSGVGNITASTGWFLYQNASLGLRLYKGTVKIASSANLAANTWTHIAVVRASGVVTLYVNGVDSGSFSGDTYSYIAGCSVGGPTQNSINGLDGMIDDVRITAGLARYTSNFTPLDTFPAPTLPTYGVAVGGWALGTQPFDWYPPGVTLYHPALALPLLAGADATPWPMPPLRYQTPVVGFGGEAGETTGTAPQPFARPMALSADEAEITGALLIMPTGVIRLLSDAPGTTGVRFEPWALSLTLSGDPGEILGPPTTMPTEIITLSGDPGTVHEVVTPWLAGVFSLSGDPGLVREPSLLYETPVIEVSGDPGILQGVSFILPVPDAEAVALSGDSGRLQGASTLLSVPEVEAVALSGEPGEAQGQLLIEHDAREVSLSGDSGELQGASPVLFAPIAAEISLSGDSGTLQGISTFLPVSEEPISLSGESGLLQGISTFLSVPAAEAITLSGTPSEPQRELRIVHDAREVSLSGEPGNLQGVSTVLPVPVRPLVLSGDSGVAREQVQLRIEPPTRAVFLSGDSGDLQGASPVIFAPAAKGFVLSGDPGETRQQPVLFAPSRGLALSGTPGAPVANMLPTRAISLDGTPGVYKIRTVAPTAGMTLGGAPGTQVVRVVIPSAVLSLDGAPCRFALRTTLPTGSLLLRGYAVEPTGTTTPLGSGQLGLSGDPGVVVGTTEALLARTLALGDTTVSYQVGVTFDARSLRLSAPLATIVGGREALSGRSFSLSGDAGVLRGTYSARTNIEFPADNTFSLAPGEARGRVRLPAPSKSMRLAKSGSYPLSGKMLPTGVLTLSGSAADAGVFVGHVLEAPRGFGRPVLTPRVHQGFQAPNAKGIGITSQPRLMQGLGAPERVLDLLGTARPIVVRIAAFSSTLWLSSDPLSVPAPPRQMVVFNAQTMAPSEYTLMAAGMATHGNQVVLVSDSQVNVLSGPIEAGATPYVLTGKLALSPGKDCVVHPLRAAIASGEVLELTAEADRDGVAQATAYSVPTVRSIQERERVIPMGKGAYGSAWSFKLGSLPNRAAPWSVSAASIDILNTKRRL